MRANSAPQAHHAPANVRSRHVNSDKVMFCRPLNERLIQLPGLDDQKTRPDCERLSYGIPVLFIDAQEAGMSREACVKALQAEGVAAGAYTYPLQHKMAIYSQAQWWHHQPALPELPGSEQAKATAISLPDFTSEQPELVDQYVAAFEKIGSRRRELG